MGLWKYGPTNLTEKFYYATMLWQVMVHKRYVCDYQKPLKKMHGPIMELLDPFVGYNFENMGTYITYGVHDRLWCGDLIGLERRGLVKGRVQIPKLVFVSFALHSARSIFCARRSSFLMAVILHSEAGVRATIPAASALEAREDRLLNHILFVMLCVDISWPGSEIEWWL